MPAPLPSPGPLETQFFHPLQGRAWSSRLFYGDGTSAEFTPADVAAVGVAADNGWAANMMPALSQDCVYTGCKVTDLFSNTAPVDEETASVAGSVAQDSLPINVCAVVKRIQPRRYRGGKSHIYL